MKEIVEALKKRISENENSMLVTVVAGRGSIPRKAGAYMVVGEDGRVTGTIGGGAGLLPHLGKGGGDRLCGRGHRDPHRLCSGTGRAVERAGRRPHRLRRRHRCSARQGRPGRRVVLWPSDPHRRSGAVGESGRQRQPGVRLGRGGGAGTPGAGHGLSDRVRQPDMGLFQQGERHLRLQAGRPVQLVLLPEHRR